MSVLIALLIVLVLSLSGFLVTVMLMRLRDPFAILGLTFVFGSVLWFLLSNGLAYVLPIRWAFLIALACIGVLDVVLALRCGRENTSVQSIFAPDLGPVTVLLALIGIVGFAHMRFLGSDPWSWQHFPLAATIAAGNFPVMSPIDPLHALHYHYAPAFLAAGFHLLANVPLSFGFAVQPLIGCAGILFFVTSTVRNLTGSVRTGLIAAIAALAGAGLLWLRGPELSHIAQFFLASASLREVAVGAWNLTSSPYTVSPLIFLGHRSTAMGFPLLYGLLWSMDRFLSVQSSRTSYAVIGFIFALGLTLTMEMAFVTVSLGAAVTAVYLLTERSSRERGASLVLFGLMALVPALLVGLLHGGVLSGFGDGGGHAFLFHPSLYVTYETGGSTVAAWNLRFLLDVGLPLFLLPFAGMLAIKRGRDNPLWVVLLVVGLTHLLLPFLIQYQLIEGEMKRAFYGATSIFSLLVGVWISEVLLASRSKTARASAVVLLVALLLSSTLSLVLRLVIPTGRLEKTPPPLFAGMPGITAEQEALYVWVRTQTKPEDYFYVRNLTVDFRGLDTETVQMRDRILFTTYTGRFTIGPIIYWDYDEEWLKDVVEAEKTCGFSLMRKLKVRYLLVETEDRAMWFQERCQPEDWSLRYDGGNTDAVYPHIYELTAKD